MDIRQPDSVREAVRRRYASIVSGGAERHAVTGCCDHSRPAATTAQIAHAIGYSPAETDAAPEGANLGLGCGNPQGIAKLRPGETVLDLGSGAGFDCFLAARQVGPAGRVIGVDMTPEMVAKARENARRGGYSQVEFRLGEIEALPAPDASVDVVLSNCVVNLSPDKPAVFREVIRVLRPGGRVAISDIIATGDIPESYRTDPGMVCGCMGQAATIEEIERMLRDAGFEQVRVTVKEESRDLIREWAPGTGIELVVASAMIEARKPGREDGEAAAPYR